jgi:hypothetical protein
MLLTKPDTCAQVGQANMELMRERIHELEEDNAEVLSLLALLVQKYKQQCKY